MLIISFIFNMLYSFCTYLWGRHGAARVHRPEGAPGILLDN